MLHFGIRDQNLELKIGISDKKIYLVTTLLSSACRPEKDTPFGGSLPILAVKGSTPPPPEIVNILKSKAHRLSKLIKLKVSSRNLSTIISDLDGFQSVNLRSDDNRNRKDNDTCLSLKISSRGSQWG